MIIPSPLRGLFYWTSLAGVSRAVGSLHRLPVFLAALSGFTLQQQQASILLAHYLPVSCVLWTYYPQYLVQGVDAGGLDGEEVVTVGLQEVVLTVISPRSRLVLNGGVLARIVIDVG